MDQRRSHPLHETTPAAGRADRLLRAILRLRAAPWSALLPGSRAPATATGPSPGPVAGATLLPPGRARRAPARLVALLLPLVLIAAVVPAAHASLVGAVQQAGARVSPTKAGTTKEPRAISLTLLSSFDPAQVSAQINAGNQFAMTSGEILLPKQGTTNAKRFPGCQPTQVLANESRCPSGSLVGRGTATGVGLNLVEHVTLKIYNRPKGAGVTVLVVSVPSAPVELRDIVVVDLKKLPRSDPFGWRLDFSIPNTLISPVAGVLASVQQLKITIPKSYLKKRGKYVYRSVKVRRTVRVRRGGRTVRTRKTVRKRVKIPYIATTGCVKKAWNGRFTASYTTAIPVNPSIIDSSQTVDVRVPCRR